MIWVSIIDNNGIYFDLCTFSIFDYIGNPKQIMNSYLYKRLSI